jgi:cyanophycinase-like exopeptidase
MTGRITIVGAGELMAAMSSLHRAALRRLGPSPRAVFLDTTAGFETNIDAISSKAVEYYAHHLQTELRVANYRHRDKSGPSQQAAAVAELRNADLIFAGPGSPTYAISQWQDSPVWDAVMERFDAGADILFASAASISLGRYALPVYEVYKAGQDPYWTPGLDVFSRFGLQLAIVPHFDDASGGENYDSRFCYMGAQRFDVLQERLPPDVTIVGIDAYTAVCFDPGKDAATVSGQGGITLIGEGGSRRCVAGSELPFDAFRSGAREVVRTYDAEHVVQGYEFTDNPAPSDPVDAITELASRIEKIETLAENEKVELLAQLQALRSQAATPSMDSEGPLVDLIVELREALRSAKRYEMADKARDVLGEMGYEVGDTAQGTRWTKH